jgi:hypothetical protein
VVEFRDIEDIEEIEIEEPRFEEVVVSLEPMVNKTTIVEGNTISRVVSTVLGKADPPFELVNKGCIFGFSQKMGPIDG